MALYTPEYKPNGNEVAVIVTDEGTIRVQLHGQDAPIHVGNFVELATKGFYMTPAEVARGGYGPNGKPGTGGPGYSIKGEWKTNPHNEHKDGTLAMARSSMPDSAGSQFYFCLGPQPFLDGDYTVFGDTIEGLDVIAKLRAGSLIESITIENAND